MCDTKRSNEHSSAKTTSQDEDDLIIYDHTLDQTIDDYGRMWKCKACTCLNLESSSSCQACASVRKRSSSAAAQPTTEQAEALSLRWTCKACTYNKNTNGRCMLCNSLRNDNSAEAARLAAASEWTCRVCSSVNHNRNNENLPRTFCAVCEHPRGSQPMQMDQDSSKKE